MPIHVLGIRHHGPGSARSLRAALEQIKPDALLVEGPPEADSVLSYVQSPEIKPPVAILAYRVDQPQQASFYPFAEFSPEWQAIQYGLKNSIPVQFMDLPLAHRFATPEEAEEKDGKPKEEKTSVAEYPLTHLARAAGFADTELWWEHQFELRVDHQDSFAAILEGMTALRDTLDLPEDRENDLREAYMRKILHEAEKNHETIAVVCGAWHAPALVNQPPKKDDRILLKGLPKCKVETTWIPWTYRRLTFASGYGAGVMSPGWYHHIWQAKPDERGYGWMTQVARVFRQHQMDTSTAHVIEAIRLADTLAALRDLARPGLAEYNEATNTVLSFGDDSLLDLVQEALIVGQQMGEVPSEVPAVPLQSDVQQHQKKLRLKPSDERKALTLDLRKDLDRERSQFLHRLHVLGINWGTPAYVSGKGTFKEQWNLYWEPEIAIRVIEKGIWGNTVASAATAYIKQQLNQVSALREVAQLLEQTLPANLPKALADLLQKLDELAALSGDIFQLMQALPPLANISRYGDVRQTDTAMINHVLDSLVSRISIGLPNASTSLNEDSAAEAFTRIQEMDSALRILQRDDYTQLWHQALVSLADHSQINGIVAGKACRILSESSIWNDEIIAQKFSLALSSAQSIGYSAAWLEGFLQGSGMVLILDETLWGLLDGWVAQLDEEIFVQTLPVLRRSFATFSKPERRKLGEKAKSGKQSVSVAAGVSQDTGFNHERATTALPLVKQLLGLKTVTNE
ncbi:MAG: DUF5682 family protein [Bacteroidota bacterium]